MNYSRHLLIRRLPDLQWAVRPYRHLCTFQVNTQERCFSELGEPNRTLWNTWENRFAVLGALCLRLVFFLKHIYLIGIHWAFIVCWIQHALSRVQIGMKDRGSKPPKGKYLLRKWIHVWYKSQISLEWVSDLLHKTLGLCLGVSGAGFHSFLKPQSVAETKQYKKQVNKLILAIDGGPLLDPIEGVRELLPTGFSSIIYMDAMKLFWPSTVYLKIFKYTSD